MSPVTRPEERASLSDTSSLSTEDKEKLEKQEAALDELVRQAQELDMGY